MVGFRERHMLVSSVTAFVVIVGFAIQISVVPSVLATDLFGGSAEGGTYCNALRCDADVEFILYSYALDVSNGDDVWYYFEISWQDERAWAAPPAEHHFVMTVSYPGRPPIVAQRYEYTDGNDYGTDTLSIEVQNVSEGAVVTVTWFAEITVPYPTSCYDSDSVGGQQGYG